MITNLEWPVAHSFINQQAPHRPDVQASAANAPQTSALKHVQTLTSISQLAPTPEQFNANLSNLQTALAGCAPLNTSVYSPSALTVCGQAQLAILAVHRWAQRAGGDKGARKLNVSGQTEKTTESNLQAVLYQAVKIAILHLNTAAQKHAASPNDASRAGLKQRAQDLRQVGLLADGLSQQTRTVAVFTAANAVGKSVEQHIVKVAQIVPDVAGLYVYQSKTQADFDRLDAVPHAAAAHLPPLGFVVQIDKPSKLPGADVGADAKVVRTSTGARYTMTAKLGDRTGMTGKVHLARSDEGTGIKYIAKVQRTEAKIAGRQLTEANGLGVILQRTSQAAIAENHLNMGLMQNRLNSPGQAPLHHAARVNVVDHFVDEFGKYYQIMPAMAGDLTDLTRTLSQTTDSNAQLSSLVAQIRLNVASQSFDQLAALHRRSLRIPGGMVHRDIKLNNIVFNEQGAVRIIDFDEVKKMGINGADAAARENKGSIASPELFLAALNPKLKGTGKPTDVWAMAVSMLAFGADAERLNPFLNPKCETSAGNLSQQAYFTAYQVWYELRVAGQKRLTSDTMAPLTAAESQGLVQEVIRQVGQMVGRNQSPTLLTYNPATNPREAIAAAAAGFNTYAGRQLQLHEEMAQLLLSRALCPRPNKRASAGELAKSLTGALPPSTPQQQQDMAGLFRRTAAVPPISDQ